LFASHCRFVYFTGDPSRVSISKKITKKTPRRRWLDLPTNNFFIFFRCYIMCLLAIVYSVRCTLRAKTFYLFIFFCKFSRDCLVRDRYYIIYSGLYNPGWCSWFIDIINGIFRVGFGNFVNRYDWIFNMDMIFISIKVIVCFHCNFVKINFVEIQIAIQAAYCDTHQYNSIW